MNAKTKVCACCGQELPISMFYANRRAKDGLQSRCKECSKQYMREFNERKRNEKEIAANTVSTISTTNPLLSHNPKFEGKLPNELLKEVKELVNELRSRGFTFEGRFLFTKEYKI